MYVVKIKILKQALNHRFNIKNVPRIIEFNLNAKLKPYIDMKAKLKIEAKKDFGKRFFEVKEQLCLWKDNRKLRKTQIY